MVVLVQFRAAHVRLSPPCRARLPTGLFYQRGCKHISLADIAEVVGISCGNFCCHLRSKEEILDAVIGACIVS